MGVGWSAVGAAKGCFAGSLPFQLRALPGEFTSAISNGLIDVAIPYGQSPVGRPARSRARASTSAGADSARRLKALARGIAPELVDVGFRHRRESAGERVDAAAC